MLDALTNRLAAKLKSLRLAREWSLEQLAVKSGVSRATLSRLEQAKVSPTTEVLRKLSTAFGLPISRLLAMVEDRFDALVPFDEQTESEDPQTGFIRRSVSPPTDSLIGEIQECHLPPNTTIRDDLAPQPSQEHHLVMLDGALRISVDSEEHALTAGDCLRYSGTCQLATGKDRGARYLLVLI